MAVAVVAGERVRDGVRSQPPSHQATKPPGHVTLAAAAIDPPPHSAKLRGEPENARERGRPGLIPDPWHPMLRADRASVWDAENTRTPPAGLGRLCRAGMEWNGLEWNAGLRETVLRYFHSASRAIRARSAVGGGSTQPYLADGQKPLSRTMVQKTRVCRVQCPQTGQRKILLFHTLHDITLHYITWHSMALHDKMEVMVAVKPLKLAEPKKIK